MIKENFELSVFLTCIGICPNKRNSVQSKQRDESFPWNCHHVLSPRDKT